MALDSAVLPPPPPPFSMLRETGPSLVMKAAVELPAGGRAQERDQDVRGGCVDLFVCPGRLGDGNGEMDAVSAES